METEIWKKHPDIVGIEVSTLGRVRTLDRTVPTERGTWLFKGRVLKPWGDGHGYMKVGIHINKKRIIKYVHRLVAQTFIPNPDNLPQINRKNCNRSDNRVSNLEWCTAKYNNQYREKYGISIAESEGHPLFAVNLNTMEVSKFRSQNEAGRALKINNGNINAVIKGRRKQAGGYYFKEDNGNGIEINRDKLNDIVAGMNFTGGIFAVNLNTLEVSRFNSQNEAGRTLGFSQGNISSVIKGRIKQTNGYFFVNDDGHAVDVVKSTLHDIGGVGLKIK